MSMIQLAMQNFKSNLRNYLAVVLSMAFTILTFVNFQNIIYSNLFEGLSGKNAEYINILVQVISVVLICFMFCFLWYATNVFLTKQKKEIGIYIFMGLTNQQIGKLYFIETVMTGIFAWILGISSGMLTTQLFQMILLAISDITVEIAFQFHIEPLILPSIVYLLFYLIFSIKGYVEAMLDGTIPMEFQEKYLNIILFETERLNKLTTSLLELNKYGKRGIMLDITKFDVNHTIKMTAQTFEGVCKEKRLSFELILTGQTLYAFADMDKIQRVIYNLIDNAIKFSPADSVITVETTVKNEKIFISVKDRGIGIPKESIGKIWERFYKSDASRGKDKKGTGLGLAIVKEIIQAHKENINVISTEDVGTEFIFSLPLYQTEDE